MIPVLTTSDIQKKISEHSYPAQKTYLAMYSTWWGGIIKDPAMMMVPIDDHLVHRGDGVFEAIKVVDGKVYLMEEHLKRLESSAQIIGLPLPMPLENIRNVLLETTKVSGTENAVLRLYISRGPGHFSTNPYDSIGSQMYLVVTHLTRLSDQKYQDGVKIGKSKIPPKESWLAKIKTCNYLPNVMMKKESVDRHLDFTIGIDHQGFLTEGSTENIVIVDKDGNLLRPELRQILKGTTMIRTLELADSLLKTGKIKSISEKNLTEKDLQTAKEAMMIGTTLDVLPVSEYEGQKIGEGRQGPVAKELLSLLREDMKSGPKATAI
ncbi:peptidase [Bdellovibrio bacteriovorus]|uniref:Peptidase n=1 Tax=Bdellovibrio bacteriovorus TaxID=959 RepID=A0A150WLK1_BDEBC|nr:aminotransferase class IV [Bdellovibrio bacteriovorus]KYG64667.1 peptidase [Bdellovibrio bacteriovorus]